MSKCVLDRRLTLYRICRNVPVYCTWLRIWNARDHQPTYGQMQQMQRMVAIILYVRKLH